MDERNKKNDDNNDLEDLMGPPVSDLAAKAASAYPNPHKDFDVITNTDSVDIKDPKRPKKLKSLLVFGGAILIVVLIITLSIVIYSNRKDNQNAKVPTNDTVALNAKLFQKQISGCDYNITLFNVINDNDYKTIKTSNINVSLTLVSQYEDDNFLLVEQPLKLAEKRPCASESAKNNILEYYTFNKINGLQKIDKTINDQFNSATTINGPRIYFLNKSEVLYMYCSNKEVNEVCEIKVANLEKNTTEKFIINQQSNRLTNDVWLASISSDSKKLQLYVSEELSPEVQKLKKDLKTAAINNDMKNIASLSSQINSKLNVTIAQIHVDTREIDKATKIGVIDSPSLRFSVSPDGSKLAYVRTDKLVIFNMLDRQEKQMNFNSLEDVKSIAWGESWVDNVTPTWTKDSRFLSFPANRADSLKTIISTDTEDYNFKDLLTRSSLPNAQNNSVDFSLSNLVQTGWTGYGFSLSGDSNRWSNSFIYNLSETRRDTLPQDKGLLLASFNK